MEMGLKLKVMALQVALLMALLMALLVALPVPQLRLKERLLRQGSRALGRGAADL